VPFHVHDRLREPLHVLVPLFNPFRYKSRWKHVERALKHFIDSGAVVTLIEAGFNRRELAFADSGLDGTLANCNVIGSDHNFRHKYIGLHTKDELWLKENLINIGAQNLPYDWQQVAWLDSDIHFVRPNWVGEIIHKLQHHDFVQPFTHARDVGPNYEVLPETMDHADGPSFISAWQQDKLPKINSGDGYYSSLNSTGKIWPGLAMAARRTAWDAVGGLPDYHIWSGADWVTGHCLIGKRDTMIRNDLHPNYINLAQSWYDTCQRYIRRNVGCVEGSVFHFFHGPKQKRGYNLKHALLAKIGFDPTRHLKRDSQGLWQLNDLGEESHIQLRDAMRTIAKERNEDVNVIDFGDSLKT
jgi:hypothetical protein